MAKLTDKITKYFICPECKRRIDDIECDCGFIVTHDRYKCSNCDHNKSLTANPVCGLYKDCAYPVLESDGNCRSDVTIVGGRR